MTLLGPILLFLLGMAMLWGGAEWLVRGAAALGRSLGISPLVVGLTVVACATSMPEMLVSLVAAMFRDAGGLALGNVVGSNIANVGLVLGLSAIVAPLQLRHDLSTRELPAMIGVSIIFLALASWGNLISRLDGLFLLLLLVGCMFWMVRTARRERGAAGNGNGDGDAADAPGITRTRAILFVIVGLAILLGGAELMTRSGVQMARLLKVPDVIIGLTMVALGTSLPELAASLVSVVRGHPELAFGNVVGSNLFNLTFVAGTVASVQPLKVEPAMISMELPIMLGFSVAMYLLMVRSSSIGRMRGSMLLVGYLAFLAWVAVRA